MEENKKRFNWSIVAIIALACLMILCLVKISDLSNQISNLQNTIANYQNKINYLHNDINSIYDNVDEKLKKEASLLSSVDYSLGELNAETHTVPVTLKVVPKSLTDDMQLSVKVGSETIALERNGNEFSATLAVNMFIDYDEYPMLNIVSGETTKTEKLEDVEVSRLFTLYLPYVYAHLESSDVLKNGKLAIDGNLMFDEKPVASNSNVTITKIELITVKNEQEIDRKDITSNVTTQSYHIPVNVSYDAKYGDKFCIYVLAKDSLGYTHKTLAYFWNDLDEHTHNSITAVDGSLEIYDKNGNLLTRDY